MLQRLFCSAAVLLVLAEGFTAPTAPWYSNRLVNIGGTKLGNTAPAAQAMEVAVSDSTTTTAVATTPVEPDVLLPDTTTPPLNQNIQRRGFFNTFSNIDEFINLSAMFIVAVAALTCLTTIDSGISRGWTTEEILSRVPIGAWESYSRVLVENPILTKACTSATVYTIGDILSQRTEGVKIADYDRLRIVRSLLAGLIGHGPLSHYWYNALDGFTEGVLGWTAWWVFFPKVVIDQIVWGPFWNNTYIVLLGLMKLETWEQIWADIKRTTIPLVVSGLKLWPAAHLVTYGLIPVENRLLWVDMVEIVWVMILATQASGKQQTVVVEENESTAKVALEQR